jgi:type I restriction enzyme S subunit
MSGHVRRNTHKIDHLVKTAYWEYFGDWYNTYGLRDPVRISDHVADSQYGVSEAMEESGTRAVLRMNSITTTGWLNLTDLKYADLSKKDVEATTLIDGDLLFNRTNSKELVGKCAIWREVNGPFSFASYLVRLRLKPDMLPEYLWATLNSAYGKYRLMNSAKQAVSMANVSPTDLGRITVPLPPLALQEKFARLINEIEGLRVEMLSKLTTFDELKTLVTQQALRGEITTAWRDQHAVEIAVTAAARDALLRERGARLASTRTQNIVQISEHVPAERQTGFSRPRRQALIDQLSSFQHEVWNTLRYEWRGAVLADDSAVFKDFCTSPQTWRLEVFDAAPINVRRALEQLAAMGLIRKFSLPQNDPSNENILYLTAFRPLREDKTGSRAEEDVALADAASVQAEFKRREKGGA